MLKKLKKFWLAVKEKLTFTKRQLFVGETMLLTTGLVLSQMYFGSIRVDVMIGLSIAAYILSAIALREDLHGWEFITLLILPAYFTAAVFLFYYLLPTRWLTRLPTAVLYGAGIYAILLTENIYNVAAERNIQLIRAAHSVGFLLTLLTVFFLVDTLLSLHLVFYLNGIIILLVVFPLVLQILWAMELTPKISSAVWWGSGMISILMTQLVIVFSFWPIKTTIEALFLTTVFYSLIGMTQQYLVGRLFSKTIKEYSAVLIIVLTLVLITTKWGA